MAKLSKEEIDSKLVVYYQKIRQYEKQFNELVAAAESILIPIAKPAMEKKISDLAIAESVYTLELKKALSTEEVDQATSKYNDEQARIEAEYIAAVSETENQVLAIKQELLLSYHQDCLVAWQEIWKQNET